MHQPINVIAHFHGFQSDQHLKNLRLHAVADIRTRCEKTKQNDTVFSFYSLKMKIHSVAETEFQIEEEEVEEVE